MPGGPEPIGTGPDGRLAVRPADSRTGGLQSCERERSLLALADLQMEFDRLTQRANRANVSFYPIDPRGLVAFDSPIGPDRPPGPAADAQILRRRQDGLRVLAAETDGTVVLNTNIDKALPRLLTDIGSYYLLGYVSTNPKLDGRYRRLTVRVKRPGLTVRARPGYLAPTAAELSVAAPPSVRNALPSAVREALSRLPTGRTVPPMYLQAAGGSGHVQITLELDRRTTAAPEWAEGATVRLEIGPGGRHGVGQARRRGVHARARRRASMRCAIRRATCWRPGATRCGRRSSPRARARRSRCPPWSPCRRPMRCWAMPPRRRGAARAPAGSSMPTADPRFRRTERLVVETPLVTSGATVAARLLNRAGQPMAVPVTLSERLDESLQLRVRRRRGRTGAAGAR